LQSFCALLQELCPLQELAPRHFVPAAFISEPLDGAAPESWAIAAEAKNSAATAEARIAPFVPLFIRYLLFRIAESFFNGRSFSAIRSIRGRKHRCWPMVWYSRIELKSYSTISYQSEPEGP
jgi:hypothetical protein